MDHDGLIVFGDRIKGLLDDMATKGIHRQAKRVAANGLCNLDYLLRSTVLEASLNQEVAETVDHQSMSLDNNGVDDLVLLFGRSDLELLLQEYRGLLVVDAYDLVDNVLPVASSVAVEQAAIVQGLGRGEIRRAFGGRGLLLSWQRHQKQITYMRFLVVGNVPLLSMDREQIRR